MKGCRKDFGASRAEPFVKVTTINYQMEKLLWKKEKLPDLGKMEYS